jgi:hypothetical protein
MSAPWLWTISSRHFTLLRQMSEHPELKNSLEIPDYKAGLPITQSSCLVLFCPKNKVV